MAETTNNDNNNSSSFSIINHHHGDPENLANSADQLRYRGWKTASLILGVEATERIATLGIALNLVTYLHGDMHISIPNSANMVTNFLGTSSLTCLLGGFIADTYFGRFRTIIIGSCLQLLGMILMVLSASLRVLRPPTCDLTKEPSTCKPANVEQLLVLYLGLYMIAFGTGGIKSSVSGLGADQFDEYDVKGKQQMQSYFNWFGFTLSTASLIAVTVLVYIQDNFGKALGYSICVICMTFSLVLYLAFSKFYTKIPPSGSPLTQIATVLVAAWRNRHLNLPSQFLYHDATSMYHSSIRVHHESSDVSSEEHTPSTTMLCFGDSRESIHHTNQFLCLDKAALIVLPTAENKILQNKWRHSSLKQVEETKMFLRLFPILCTNVVFWTTNAQMLTFSVEQGATLKRNIGKHFEIPPASLSMFTQIATLVTLATYDRVLIPLMRIWRRNEYGITSLQRIGVGLFVSIIAMVVASLVEKRRLHVAHSQGNVITPVLPMSVFYLVPQYALIGIADAFTYIGQLEFFFREAPNGTRSLGTGLCLAVISLGFFLSSALVNGVNKLTRSRSTLGWIPNNLNQGRLDHFYLLLAILSTICFIVYLVLAHWYKYNHAQKVETTKTSQDETLTTQKC